MMGGARWNDLCRTRSYLAHFGVLGMKWGVRRNASKTFAKASQKATKLESKSASLLEKGASKQYRGAKRGNQKAYFKGLKLSAQGSKLAEKARKWEKKMTKYFSETKMSDIRPEHLSSGKKYVYMLLSN